MKGLGMVAAGIVLVIVAILFIGMIKPDLAAARQVVEDAGYNLITFTDSLNILAIKLKTDNLPTSPANETTSTSIKTQTDKIPTLATQDNVTEVLNETEIIENHLHNTVRWYGLKVPQTATEWASATSMTPFQATSGNNTWGPALQVFGTADTLQDPLFTWGDFNEILPVANSSATVYRIRFIWGAADNATAIAAGQWTEIMFIRGAADNNRKVMQVISPRIPITDKIWCQIWNATNNATLDFYVAAHGYRE
jgi:competence protein ComGC